MMLIDVRCLIRIRVASRGVLPAPRELDRQEIRGLMEPRGLEEMQGQSGTQEKGKNRRPWLKLSRNEHNLRRTRAS